MTHNYKINEGTEYERDYGIIVPFGPLDADLEECKEFILSD